MGMVAKETSLTGLFGGVHVPKNGGAYMSVISEGPKIDKVKLSAVTQIVGADAPFGMPVRVELFDVEQKFQDFNGSYSVAVRAVVSAIKR